VDLLKKKLSDNPNDELITLIASTVVDEMGDQFPELKIRSRKIQEVIEEFREKKLGEVRSERQYSRKIDYIETYFHTEVTHTVTDELTSEDIERYRKWRKYESLHRDDPLSDTTLRDDMYLFRDFVEYLAEHKLVPVRLTKSIDIPQINYEGGEGVDKKVLEPDSAKTLLDYLHKYHYADVEHVVMELLCDTGCRKGGLFGRDLVDFDSNENVLHFRHREETPLKKADRSEREVKLKTETAEVVRDYIQNRRPDVTDEYGRKSLLTKGTGRMSRSTIQKIAYKWTRPCVVGLDCPHDRDPEECEAAQKNNAAYQCPSSRAPHHIRKGYITDHRNRGVSSDAIDQRCDVSPRVQKLHYDLPSPEDERKRYQHEFESAKKDPRSGYSN